MGIFSSKKITYVASAAYNMAGDYPERMNYMQTVVVGAVLSSNPRSYVGETISASMISGPYAGQRALMRWAKTHYTEGLPKMLLGGGSSIDVVPCTAYLDSIKPFHSSVNRAFAAKAEAEQWAIQFIYNMFVGTDVNLDSLEWTYDLYSTVPPVVTVDIVGHGIHQVPMANYNESAEYAYIDYYKIVNWSEPPFPVPGNLVMVPGSDANYIGYLKDNYGTISNQIFVDYEVLSARYHTSTETFSITVQGDVSFMAPYSMVHDAVEYVMPFIYDKPSNTSTASTVIPALDIVDSVEITFSFTAVAPEPPKVREEYVGPYLEIYRYGSGNPIMEPTKPPEVETSGQLMPFAPIRIENKFIDKPPYEDVYYDKVKGFYKRASGGQKVSKLIDAIADNESLDDIDFAFMVFGVSLNTKSKYTKQYIYEFLLTLINIQTVTTSIYDEWVLKTAEKAEAGRELIEAGKIDGWDTPEVREAEAKYNAIKVPRLPYNTISQKSEWLPNLYQIYLHWCYCQQESVDPSMFPSRKKGEVWIVPQSKLRITSYNVVKRREGGGDYSMELVTWQDVFDRFTIYRKNSETSVTKISVMGFQQENIVYNGQAVWIGASDALADEDESGLLCPMHMDTVKRLSGKARNQLCVENTYMIFNCYQIVKQKWYQKGIFKVIFAIVIAIASVFFAPLGAGFGILGSNLALGVTMGFAAGTLTAAIAGAVVNALAGMIVSQLFSTVMGALFKGKLGAIFGTLVMFFGGMLASSFATGSFNLNWGDIFSPKNILNLTNSVTKAATAWYQADILDIQKQMEHEADKYKTESDRIRDLTYKLLGTDGRSFLDPMMFTGEPQILNESSESFLDRTLLTGSDIVELSKMMVENFAELNLQLPEAFQ